MKFLIDADSPYSLVEIFNKYGHDATHVRRVLKFASDDEIFEYADKNQFVIITRDLGFAKMFMENKGLGLVLIRLPYYFTADKIVKVFDEFLKEVDVKNLISSITVIELGRYRIRKI